MCRCLNESPQLSAVLQSGLVPSEDELQNYRGRVGRLEKKKVLLTGTCISQGSETHHVCCFCTDPSLPVSPTLLYLE